MIRLIWSLFLFSLSIPGLLLWLPVFLTTAYSVHNFKKTGPIWDTWDEIAQYKLIYGLLLIPILWPVHPDDLLRFGVRSMRLAWGHIGDLAVHQYGVFHHTSADVDDPPVRLLGNIETMVTQHD